jgi:large subunit ribosomal protein L44e
MAYITMKLPKNIKRLCPYCRKHTEHKVAQAKKKNPSSLTYGSKYRAKKRGRARGAGNQGRYSKPAISKFKMTGKKATKKTDLRYNCSECKKSHVQSSGIRAKKVEFQ